MSETVIDQVALEFREVMARVCTPVAVITAFDDQRPHGTTVSAFTSLSMGPPMVLVSLDRGSDLLAIIRRTGRFGVNVLAHDQADVAMRFARKGADKFDGIVWSESSALPRLDGTSGWLACTTESLVDGGDHVVALGNIAATGVAPVAPLTYHDRVFGTHRAFEVAS
ncbi:MULTISPECIES: flavin reductase family protein [Gordonia]|uniref:Flavin reductase family protein n=1 Tax=Gordonia amicalis TaxID=89053 RepID=A0AAE4U725_9ACTN|nr:MULTISPECIES: flavin reductase family protein [Gordonia]KAF0967336.1 Flavin-dependent monooxygenase, reductase subunit HsaB [Gordonia sp. YY1]MCZ4652687.1 flavin reductase family protein [Gordonia amicalis]MDV6306739.1 flavin reductase family protein [Gordonia amicalis]MDV6310936.1 flavin reductase family protein [Gordonia amicalis]MDV7099059.1 flavin reductase family protein [Gordonia amicalis]